MYGCENAGEQSAADGHLGQLECSGTGVADDPCTDLDDPGLQAC